MSSPALRTLRAITGAAAALLTVTLFTSGVAQAQDNDRYAAIVMDARSGEVLLEDQADEARFPASLTKMMTLYMVFEALERGDINMNTRLTASRNASRQPPSRLGLRCTRRRGCDTITVEQAINALVVQSANDVATLLAERLGGSESRFAANMSARARELGMRDTRFANASGLPNPRHRTTARDMAILGQALWRDFPEYYSVFQTPDFSWRRGYGRNHNHLLGQVQGVDGIKTGYTRASGFNLASMAERNGRRVVVVVLGGESAAARDAQVTYLIEGAYQEFARREDPNTATLAGMPTNRLDSPSVVTAVAAAAPRANPDGSFTETLTAETSLEAQGQGDLSADEESTEEPE